MNHFDGPRPEVDPDYAAFVAALSDECLFEEALAVESAESMVVTVCAQADNTEAALELSIQNTGMTKTVVDEMRRRRVTRPQGS